MTPYGATSGMSNWEETPEADPEQAYVFQLAWEELRIPQLELEGSGWKWMKR